MAIMVTGCVSTFLVLQLDEFRPKVGDIVVFRPGSQDADMWQMNIPATPVSATGQPAGECSLDPNAMAATGGSQGNQRPGAAVAGGGGGSNQRTAGLDDQGRAGVAAIAAAAEAMQRGDAPARGGQAGRGGVWDSADRREPGGGNVSG